MKTGQAGYFKDKRMTRGEFLKVCGKISIALFAWAIAPVDFSWAKELNGKDRFTIRIKPFKVSDIYRAHEWAG